MLLLDIIPRNEELRNAIRAVTNNYRSLYLTIGMMAVFIYIFATIGFHFLRHLYVDKYGDPLSLHSFFTLLFAL